MAVERPRITYDTLLDESRRHLLNRHGIDVDWNHDGVADLSLGDLAVRHAEWHIVRVFNGNPPHERDDYAPTDDAQFHGIRCSNR